MDVGEFLGIDLKSGRTTTVGGISEGMEEPVYFHKVQIWVEESWLIEVEAGFVRKLKFNGILGRSGFFDPFVVKFDHTKDPPQFEIEKIPSVQ